MADHFDKDKCCLQVMENLIEQLRTANKLRESRHQLTKVEYYSDYCYRTCSL